MDAMIDLKTRKLYYVQADFTAGQEKDWLNIKLIGIPSEPGKTPSMDLLLGHPCVVKLDGYNHHYHVDNPLYEQSSNGQMLFYGVMLDKLSLLTGTVLRLVPASNLELMAALHGEISEKIEAFKEYEKEAQMP
ncbi:MAG: hypothetical protein V3U54_07605 [Thermodesulfobacteriota bacterium]